MRRSYYSLWEKLTGDSSVQFVEGDFFRWLTAQNIMTRLMLASSLMRSLLDMEHTPDCHLSASHAAFYQLDGLRRFARHLCPKGIFALWSNQHSNDDFLRRHCSIFAGASEVKILFHNTLRNLEFIQGMYLEEG